MTHIEITGTIIPDEDQHFYDFLGYPASSPRKVSQALKEAGGDDVLILINSYGGDVFSASAIYDALRSYEGSLTIRVTGLAASAASVIAMAGRCEMAPTALMMIHNAWSYTTGDYRDMQKASEDLEKISQGMTLAYMEKSGKSEEEVREIMDHETWYTAAQAVAEGFADKVAEYEKQKTQAAAYIGHGLTDSTRQKIDALIGQADKPQGGTDKGKRKTQTALNILKLKNIKEDFNHEEK